LELVSHEIQRIPVNLIITDPSQPRQVFKEDEIDRLLKSMESVGLLQPVSLKPSGDGKYIIIAGERRFRCACRLGWSEIPAIIRDIEHGEFRKLQMMENVVRADLNPVELAKGFKLMIDEGMSPKEVADSLGWDAGNVSYYVALLNCRNEVLHLLSIGQIKVTVARQLAKLSQNGQLTALRVFQMRTYSNEEMISICERLYAQENQIELVNVVASANLKRLRRFMRTLVTFGKELRWVRDNPDIMKELKVDQKQIEQLAENVQWLNQVTELSEDLRK
jgi:ParB family chromosome partitioning protein